MANVNKRLLIAKLVLAVFVALVQFLYLLIQDPIVYIITNISVILGYLFEVIPELYRKGTSIVKVVSWICLVYYGLVALISVVSSFFRIDSIFEQLKDSPLSEFFNQGMPVISFVAVCFQVGYILLLIFQQKTYE